MGGQKAVKQREKKAIKKQGKDWEKARDWGVREQYRA